MEFEFTPLREEKQKKIGKRNHGMEGKREKPWRWGWDMETKILLILFVLIFFIVF